MKFIQLLISTAVNGKKIVRNVYQSLKASMSEILPCRFALPIICLTQIDMIDMIPATS